MKALSKAKEGLAKTGIVVGYLFKKPKLVRRMISHLYKGYFLEMGWINSFMEKRPVDREGRPIPWLTYSMLEFLDERLTGEMSVFEYGGGNSTLYFSSRVKEVTTVEHSRDWYEHLRRNVPENSSIIYCELEYDGKYSRTATDSERKYDIIVVDGRDRVNCAANAVNAVSDSGVIIFDDFERERYQAASELLKKNGFRQFNFWGFKPGLFDRVNTALFYRDANVFGL